MSFAPEHFTAWVEIPVTDLDRAMAFYNAVFTIDMQQDDTGPNPVAFFPTASIGGVGGHLYPGTPAKDGRGPTVHFSCPDALEDAMARVKQAGGTVLSEVIAIPVAKFVYCLDPDGNSFALFAR